MSAARRKTARKKSSAHPLSARPRSLQDIQADIDGLQRHAAVVRQPFVDAVERINELQKERDQHPDTRLQALQSGLKRDWTAADIALAQAHGIIDLLQGAACHGAIEPPANDESLARSLEVVLQLLEQVRSALWPRAESVDADDAS